MKNTYKHAKLMLLPYQVDELDTNDTCVLFQKLLIRF